MVCGGMTSLFFPSVPSAVQSLSDDLLKYYQQITRAILGEDPHLMKVWAVDQNNCTAPRKKKNQS